MPSDIFSPFSSSRQQIPMVQIPQALLIGPTVRPSTLPKLPTMTAHGGGGGSPVSLMNLMHRMEMDRERLALQQQRLEQGTGKVAEANLKKQTFDNAMLELVQTPGLRQEYDQIMQLPAMVRLKRLKELEKKYVQPLASRIHDDNVRSHDMFNALFGGDVAQAEIEHERRTSDAATAIPYNFAKGGATLWAAIRGLLGDSREWAKWRDEVHKELDEQTEYGRYQRELANAGVGAWDRAEGLSGMANLLAEQALPVGSFFIPNVGLARLGMGARALMGANAGFGAILGAGLTDLDFNSMINNANIPEEQKQAALRSGARAINTGVGAITGAVAPNFAGAVAPIPVVRGLGNLVNRAANISPRLGGAANAALGMAGLTTAQVPVTNWAYQSQTNPYLPPEEQQHNLFAGYGDALRLAALTGGLVGGITGYRPPVPTAQPTPVPTDLTTPIDLTTPTTPTTPRTYDSALMDFARQRQIQRTLAQQEEANRLAQISSLHQMGLNDPTWGWGDDFTVQVGAANTPTEAPLAAPGEVIVPPYEAPLALPPGQLNTNIDDIPRPPATGIDTSITPLTPEQQISLTEYLDNLFLTPLERRRRQAIAQNMDLVEQDRTQTQSLQAQVERQTRRQEAIARNLNQLLQEANRSQAQQQSVELKTKRQAAINQNMQQLEQEQKTTQALQKRLEASFKRFVAGRQNLEKLLQDAQNIENNIAQYTADQLQANELAYQGGLTTDRLPTLFDTIDNLTLSREALSNQLQADALENQGGMFDANRSSLYDTITDLFTPTRTSEPIRRSFINNDINSPEAWTDINRPNLDFLPQSNINGRTSSNNNQINSGVAASTQGNAPTVTPEGTPVASQNNTANTGAGTRGQQTSQLGTNASNTPINQEQTVNSGATVRPNGEPPSNDTPENSSAGSPSPTTDGGAGNDQLPASISTNQRPTDNINQTFKTYLTDQPIAAQHTVPNYVAFLDTVNNLTGPERNAVLAQSILKSAELAGWQGAKNKAGNYFLTPKYPELNTALTDAAQEYQLKNDTLPDLPLEDFINYYNQHSGDTVQYTKDRLITGNKSVTTTRVREFTNKFLQNIKRVEPLDPKKIASTNEGCS